MTDVALYNQPHTAVLYVDDAMIPVVVDVGSHLMEWMLR